MTGNVIKACLVVVKSTVPIWTNDRVEGFLKENIVNNVHIETESNTELLAQWTVAVDTLYDSRIVIGVEMIKYAPNYFLVLKISFMNEMTNVYKIVEADIQGLTKGMSYDSIIGNKLLNVGLD